MRPLRFAMAGAGFWARYQLAGWQELGDVACVAICDREPGKAAALARALDVPAAYEDAAAMLAAQDVDFLDVVTDVNSHASLVRLGAQHRLPVICQKPLGPSLDVAREMIASCEAAGVPLLVHENWRWQAPIRALKAVLDSGRLGTIVRARIDYAHSFPVFVNQPFLKELDQFILTDIGTHILDVARFLWGEASELYCQTRRIHQDIKGEDVATVMLRMDQGVTVTCNMSYASCWEFDRFPETFVAVEGSRGGVSLGPDFILTETTDAGTDAYRVPPPPYAWADPAYALIHASIVACHRHLRDVLRGRTQAETSGADNLKTLALVFAAYESAASGRALRLGGVAHAGGGAAR
jgi:D-apiose dehydrogenase